MMLVVWHPVDLIDFDLSEGSAFHLEDVLQELFLSVHVVPIVLAA